MICKLCENTVCEDMEHVRLERKIVNGRLSTRLEDIKVELPIERCILRRRMGLPHWTDWSETEDGQDDNLLGS